MSNLLYSIERKLTQLANGHAINKFAVILPTYNEAANLTVVVRAICAALPDATIIVIDDDSPDGTGEVAVQLQGEYPTLILIRHPRGSGLASAYRAGYAHALLNGFAYVIQMDADGSHDPAQLPEFAKIAPTYDLVIGSRYASRAAQEHCPWGRRVLRVAAHWYVYLWLRIPSSDVTSGFRLLSRRMLEYVASSALHSHGYIVQIETAWIATRGDLRVAEIPIQFLRRVHGRSKLTVGIVVEALWRVPLLRWRNR